MPDRRRAVSGVSARRIVVGCKENSAGRVQCGPKRPTP